MYKRAFGIWAALLLSVFITEAQAGGYPVPQEGDWVARDFHFHSGEMLPEVRLHYTTVGASSGEPVLILHGTAGSGSDLLRPPFAGELFGPGQPLDAAKYFIILPDAIGAGKSAKPSDGLRTQFPHYDYADLIDAQYRLLTEALGIHHLRLVLGYSMGGMETWLWGERHPGFMDALVPMASQPSPMAGRNWMLRRMLIETIRADPDYKDGNYVAQPNALRYASVLFDLATNGGTLALQAQGSTHAAADAYVDKRLARPAPADANDFIYQWNASSDYDPSADLGKISAPVLAINSADDERNPPETGIMTRAMTQLKNGHLLLIPGSAETSGHGTDASAKFWAAALADFLQTVPRRPM